MRSVALVALCPLVLAIGCGETMVEPPPAGPSVAVLGAGNHSIESVAIEVIADSTDDLTGPRDLAFDPYDPGSLYIVNRNTSVVILRNAGTSSQTTELHAGEASGHFLAKPAAIAFGQSGLFATAPEEDEVTQEGDPTDFMGPSMWTTDPEIFDAGFASHMDMLHNSPNSAGIAWERDNVYWVFSGSHSALTRFDFAEDHGPGGTDHQDGVVQRFVAGQVAYRPRVPSHMEFVEGLLYVADTGNNRVAVLDPTGATVSGRITRNFDGVSIQSVMAGGTLSTLVEGATIERMRAPSGLAIDGDVLFIGDYDTARIWAFDLHTGELIDWLDLDAMIEPGGLMGLEFDSEGRLLVVDSLGSRLLRISPLASTPAP